MKMRPSSPSYSYPLLLPLSLDSDRRMKTQGQGLKEGTSHIHSWGQELPGFRNALVPCLLGQVPMGSGAQMLLPTVDCPWGGVSSDACPLGMWRDRADGFHEISESSSIGLSWMFHPSLCRRDPGPHSLQHDLLKLVQLVAKLRCGPGSVKASSRRMFQNQLCVPRA